MNERIEAYLKQHHCCDYFNSYGETVHDDHYIMYREEVEELIELIVAECILTIQMGITRDGHDSEKYLRSMKHIKQIKEHFGVKE